jgi:hypothetical protein
MGQIIQATQLSLKHASALLQSAKAGLWKMIMKMEHATLGFSSKA